MEPFDIKLTVLIAKIITNDNFLFLCQNLVTPSLFSHQKKTEKKKFSIKNEFLKITWIDYLIAKKYKELK